MTANQLPVEPHHDEPDPTIDRAVTEVDLRGRALGRLKKKADFRVHLLIYVLVNGMLVLIWAMTGAGFFWPVFPIAGWGIGVVANAVDAYVVDAPTEEQIETEMERLRRR
ncbi:2TM domain-containing protein [Terrabacter sp. Soil811]|uniref:2TM domain-containing protein n=1 Tax=Terrabacter sp. Soil811 TaxID=1736419 RepID=UPI000B031410|nr:2TM domain-containing protein [Terrabacter sp. Soil811]